MLQRASAQVLSLPKGSLQTKLQEIDFSGVVAEICGLPKPHGFRTATLPVNGTRSIRNSQGRASFPDADYPNAPVLSGPGCQLPRFRALDSRIERASCCAILYCHARSHYYQSGCRPGRFRLRPTRTGVIQESLIGSYAGPKPTGSIEDHDSPIPSRYSGRGSGSALVVRQGLAVASVGNSRDSRQCAGLRESTSR